MRSTTKLSDYSISVGVPFLTRSDKLSQFLSSIPGGINKVIVADNGPPEVDRECWRDQTYDFNLDVLDLGVDIGIGACRSAIAEAMDSNYLLVADSDMTIPHNVINLLRILDNHSELGAVSGTLSEHDTIRAGVTDFYEDRLFFDRTALVQSIRETKTISWESGYPVAKFDKLPNAMICRRECIEDYNWDKNLKNEEHLDFFIGHYKNTNWIFRILPLWCWSTHEGKNTY